MNSRIAVAVGLAAVLAAVLVPISTLTPAFAAEIAADVTTASSSKTDNAYSPNPIEANVGDTVTWTNRDSTPHTVTSGSGSPDGNFDSSPGFNPLMPPQGTFSHTFDAEGEFPYYCGLHPNMVGTVIVATGGQPEPEPEPEPEPTPQEFSVTTTGAEESFEVTGSGTAQATAATINPNESVVVEFSGAGATELTLPTEMISGITAVMAGTETITHQVVSEDAESTTISFEVPEGETSVTILADTVIPEFPVIAAILAATIAGIIGYTRFARNGTWFFGRA